MKRELLTAIGFMMVASSVAFAQSPSNTAGNSTAASNSAAASDSTTAGSSTNQADGSTLRQKLSANLKNAGYTDVKIEPDPFIVEAKSKSGKPTVMFLTPDSMTVFTAKNAKGQSSQTAPGGTPSE